MSLLTTCALALMLASPSKPTNPKTATVTIEGQRSPVRSAHFGIHIQAEFWDPASKSWKGGLHAAGVSYSLEVDVDEHSGEDGAPAPSVGSIPVGRAFGGRHPSLAALSGLTVRELQDGDDCEMWDAWFGNDAPGLCGNVVTFGAWDGPALGIRWQAHYEERRQRKPFAFEGPAEFTGIYVSVRRGEDPDAYVKAGWGGQPVATLDRHFLGGRDYGPDFPAERRHTETYVYMPKGLPLSKRWTRRSTAAPASRP